MWSKLLTAYFSQVDDMRASMKLLTSSFLGLIQGSSDVIMTFPSPCSATPIRAKGTHKMDTIFFFILNGQIYIIDSLRIFERHNHESFNVQGTYLSLCYVTDWSRIRSSQDISSLHCQTCSVRSRTQSPICSTWRSLLEWFDAGALRITDSWKVVYSKLGQVRRSTKSILWSFQMTEIRTWEFWVLFPINELLIILRCSMRATRVLETILRAFDALSTHLYGRHYLPLDDTNDDDLPGLALSEPTSNRVFPFDRPFRA